MFVSEVSHESVSMAEQESSYCFSSLLESTMIAKTLNSIGLYSLVYIKPDANASHMRQWHQWYRRIDSQSIHQK